MAILSLWFWVRRIPLRPATLIICACCAWMPAQAAESTPARLEQQVKAAFLFKFGGYVEWPMEAFQGTDSPLTIGVAGDSILAKEISRVVEGRTMNGRSVTVVSVQSGDPLAHMHILYISRSELGRLNELSTKAKHTLIVTDVPKGLVRGSVINFVIVDDRVRFEISLETANRSGLKIASPLLSVALRVLE